MGEWFRQTIVDGDRLPLFCFFTGMIVGFASIRFSTRMIRAGVRWWPGNIESGGGLHIHHVVFGVVMMLLGGIVGFSVPAGLTGWRAAAAALFGVGSALVLDEFALILRLRDVYWSQEGRLSVEAVFVALAALGLLLIGERPVFVSDIGDAVGEGGAEWAVGSGLAAFNFGLVAVTLFKGKFWTGFLGLFFPVLLLVSAVRLSRPSAPWARWRYHGPGTRRARKLERAVRRERRLRAPVMRMWDRLSDLVAGRPDAPDPPRAAESGPRRPGDVPSLSSRTSRSPRRR